MYLVVVVVQARDAFFVFDVPDFGQAVGCRTDELLALSDKIDS